LDDISFNTSEGAVNDLACQDNAPDKFMFIGVIPKMILLRDVMLLYKLRVECPAAINACVVSQCGKMVGKGISTLIRYTVHF
jgi:hypothetical protein